MAESLSQELESTTVGIYRTAAVVKGGRRFSFAALVVVGDRNGRVGIGYGKAPGVPAAIEKAQKDARKGIVAVSLKDGTIAHPVNQRFGASIVRLVPAAPGTGVIAGATVRAVLELAGVKDCLTKAYGSTNQKNLCKATFAGLQALRTKEDIVALRGVEIEKTEVEEILEAGKRFAPQTASSEAPVAKGPVNVVGKGKGGQRGRGGRGGGGGRGRGGAPQAPAPAPATEAPATEAPAPAAEAPAPAAGDKPAEGA